jgi:sporulation-control protein
MTMGLRTELSVARAVDKTDLDPISVSPLPAQERILDALSQLGFQFKNADVERGRLRGVHQQLPFYQEIEFYPPPYARRVNEVEVTFVATQHGMDVVLELDKRGGMFTSGHDAYGRLQVDYASADRVDWAGQIDAWLREAIARRPAGFGGPGHGGHKGHRRGSGLGGVAAGAAAGILGGMVLGEVVDGAFGGDFGGDFGGE